MIYLPVGDIAESLRRVQDEGGNVVKTSQTEDGAYVYAAIQDPVGAYFALMPA
jgi:predicted enzyme related to lactoylglutathione lyase